MGIRRVSTQMKSEPLTEQSIQRRLNYFFASWKYNVDGLYVFSWESDKLIWTKAGYIYEFEIKISRADFRNDFKHKKEKHIILSSTIARERSEAMQLSLFEEKKKSFPNWSEESLHQQFGSVDHTVAGRKMPNYFYYVVPEGLIQPEEVPPYAGLIWILKEYYMEAQGYIIKRQAPCLHKTKYKDGELNLGEKFYYNWQADRRLRKEVQRDRDSVYRSLQEEIESKGQEMTYKSMENALKRAEGDAAYYKKEYGAKCRDLNIERMIRRRVLHALLEVKPDFDYKAVEEEVEKIYGIK